MMFPANEQRAAVVARRRRRACLVGLLLLAAVAAAAVIRYQNSPVSDLETATVNRGDVLATVEAEGHVESAHNVEVSCQVDGGSTILWIVPDGTPVKKGDELVRFDSSGVEDLLSQQTILVERAKAAQIAAEHELAAARLALPEYVEGTFVELDEEAEAAIVKAGHDLQMARQGLASAKRLMRLGYVPPTQVEAHQSGVEQAVLQLDIAHRAKTVLETYNRPKMTQDLRSRLDTAAAMVRSTTAEYELAQAQLSRYHRQLEQCVVRAPRSGLVIHANDPGRRSGDAPQIELGALVRQHQVVIWLPDLSAMRVRSLVHESSVLRVRPGLRAAVRVRGRDLPAVITDVANQPAPTRSMQQHLKFFVVSALIDERSPGLRPGETADLTILLDYRPDVLRAPLETVVKQDDGIFVWVDHDGEVEPRRVELGTFGDDMAEVRRGLSEGERLLLNPREKLPELGESPFGERHPFDGTESVSTGRSLIGQAAGG
jgi:multidrug efflux pump subunit AcrA (membrane-fusion protein)